jgi:GT2 family glycosyltransferase
VASPIHLGVTTVNVPDLSIVIVNWNSRDFLEKCLSSVRERGAGLRHEVIVVDNASFDGSAELVERQFPEVRFIQSERNLGFGKANNLGVERSTGRHVLFLNPDTEIVGDALAALVAFADQRPDAGVVGPKLLNSDLSIQMESIRAFPSLANQILDSHYLKSRFPRLGLWGMRPLYESSDTPEPVDVVSGACMMVKREVFDRVGGFSSRYFMYSEDVDLCYKVREAGWKTYFQGRAEVVHHGGKSSALTPVSQFAAVLMRESRFRFLRSARGTAYAVAYRSMTAASALCRLALLVLSFPVLGARRGQAVGTTIGKWVSVLRWSVGLERWVKTLG